MDLWPCQFLGVDYKELKLKALSGATDQEAPHTDREDVLCFMDYIKADEGRPL